MGKGKKVQKMFEIVEELRMKHNKYQKGYKSCAMMETSFKEEKMCKKFYER